MISLFIQTIHYDELYLFGDDFKHCLIIKEILHIRYAVFVTKPSLGDVKLKSAYKHPSKNAKFVFNAHSQEKNYIMVVLDS